MDRIKTIISNNEKKNEQDIFRFPIMLVLKVIFALMMAILTIKYCYEKEWASAIIDGILAILWCANIVIEINILVLKIKSNSRMMSLYIQHELTYEKLMMLNDVEKAVRFGEEETE